MVGAVELILVADLTMISIAMPSVQRDFQVSDSSRQWIISAYTSVFAGLILLGGRLVDRFGRRAVIVTGALGFAVSAIVVGTAGDSGVLIAGRAGQGAFAAVLTPANISVLTRAFTDPRDRARAFGLFGAIMTSGGGLGLVAGGALTEFSSWRWWMCVSTPIAIGAAVAAWVLLPREPGDRGVRLDLWSALLSTGGVVALVWFLSLGSGRGWGSAEVLVLIGVAVLLLAAFVVRQLAGSEPLLPLHLFRDRRRVSAYLSVAGVGFGLLGMFLLLTYQFQETLGFGALTAGLAFLPMLVGNAVAAALGTHRMLRRTGLRVTLVCGLLLLVAGMLIMSRVTPDASYWWLVMPAEVALGCGAGLIVPTAMSVATVGVDDSDTGIASAVFSTCQLVGTSIGVALLNSIATTSAGARGQGYASASAWAAVILCVVCVAAGVLAGNVRPRQNDSQRSIEAARSTRPSTWI